MPRVFIVHPIFKFGASEMTFHTSYVHPMLWKSMYFRGKIWKIEGKK